MVIYILTFIGAMITLHGFLSWQLFFIGLGFAWNFTVLAIADKLNLYAKSTPDLREYRKILDKDKKNDDNIRY